MTTSRRRTSRRSSGRGRSTPTTWWNEASANNLLGPGVSARFALADPTSATLPATFQAGFTVVRMLIDVIVRSAAINQFNFGAYGVLVRIGTSVIDMILSLLGYYLHKNWDTISGGPLEDMAQFHTRSYDIRTARRVRGENRKLDFGITNNSGSGGSIRWSVHCRLLLKL